MSTVIYLANQQVQAVVGTAGAKKISVQKAYTAEAPEGSIINGIIMDPESFQEFIKEFWETNKLPTKDVIVVINSTKFIGQTIELPKLKDAKTLEYIDREFSDLRKEDNVVYGYIPLASKDANMRRIYAECIPVDFIKEYMEIFREAGVTVKEIHSGESSLISLTNMTVANWYDTFVMLIADNITLTTLLWVDKSFYYFNSVRCFHEQGTEEYAMDVARSVSQIIQFMQAHQIEHQLENIRFAGIPELDTRIYRIALEQQGISVPIEPFDSSALSADKADVQCYLHATSGLVANGKWQNFLTQFNSKKFRKGENGGLGKGVITVIVTLVIMIIATIASFAMRVIKQGQLDALEEEINDPIVLLDVAQYDEYLDRNTFLSHQYGAIKDLDDNITSYPICDDGIIKIIDNCSGNFATVEFESFDANEGLVTVVAKAENVDNINKFIRELLAQDIFNNVDYTGYSFDNETGLWDIHVNCTLKEAVGR